MVRQLHRPHDGFDEFGCDLFLIGSEASRGLILALGDGDWHGYVNLQVYNLAIL